MTWGLHASNLVGTQQGLRLREAPSPPSWGAASRVFQLESFQTCGSNAYLGSNTLSTHETCNSSASDNRPTCSGTQSVRLTLCSPLHVTWGSIVFVRNIRVEILTPLNMFCAQEHEAVKHKEKVVLSRKRQWRLVLPVRYEHHLHIKK
jgi:hypothetical protein